MPFHGFYRHLVSWPIIWNARSNYMENAVKLFLQVSTAQSFQVNIEYYYFLMLSLTGTTDAIKFLVYDIRGDQMSRRVTSATQLSADRTTR